MVQEHEENKGRLGIGRGGEEIGLTLEVSRQEALLGFVNQKKREGEEVDRQIEERNRLFGYAWGDVVRTRD